MKKLTLLITSNIFNVNALNELFEGYLMVAFFVSGCNRIVTLVMSVEISVKYSKSLCAPLRDRNKKFGQL